MRPDHVMFVGLRGSDYPRIADLPWRLSAIVRQGSSRALPPDALQRLSVVAGFETLGDPSDLTAYESSNLQIEEQAHDATRRLGLPRGVVGLYEHTVLPAARLRRTFGVPGLEPEVVEVCRDKVSMKNAARAGGVTAPEFRVLPEERTAESDAALRTFFDVAGPRLVAKPRRQAAAKGIHVVDSFDALRTLREQASLTDYEIEAFVAGDVLHVDGVVRGRRLLLLTASRYLHPPVDVGRDGIPLGSVLVSDRDLLARIEDRTRASLRALDVNDTVFHLELILTSSSELVFVELACRMGGGEIDWLHRTLLGVDLVREAILAGANAPSALSHRTDGVWTPTAGHAAWLMTPFPESGPGTVTGVDGLQDLPAAVVATKLPREGDLMSRDAVRPNSGSFLFQATTHTELRRAVDQVLRCYRVHTG